MEVQGNGIFVFPRKGLGLEGTEVIPGKLAALLFVSQEQGESEGAQMLPAELVWWSHRMKPPSLTLGYSEPAQDQGTPKETHCQRLHCSPGPQHLSIPIEDPPKARQPPKYSKRLQILGLNPRGLCTAAKTQDNHVLDLLRLA